MWKKEKKQGVTEGRRSERPSKMSLQEAEMDPLGSWTGVPANPEELPVQDADDL